MQFDHNFIEQVRSGVGIVDLVSQYVSLKKSGANHAGLCPFHNEKTPSFLVSEPKQIFKCFGCGEGGDVFKFLMLMEGLAFPEAVRLLAERCGIPLPSQAPAELARQQDRRRLLDLMERADRLFRKWLDAPWGDGARGYLRRREVSEEVVQALGLGYAPPGNRLWEALRGEGASEADALACGLIKRGESGDLYDRFRNRILFPIKNLSGSTIAFGGRALGDGLPKYLNSPETPLYNKSSHLYGLHLSREEIRKRGFAILVEGYFDFLTPYQFGFANAVASLGTSLTEGQVKLLGRYTRQVVINYDPDAAGVAAALRSIEIFLKQSFRVNIALLPAGLDPDSFLRREGAEAYQRTLKDSQPFMDFVLGRLIAERKDPRSPRSKQEIIQGILPYLVKIPDKIERSQYVSRIGNRVGVDERLIRAELRRMAPGRTHRAPPPALRQLREATPSEKTLLAAALHAEWSARFLDMLEPELFEGLPTQGIFEKLLQLRELKREISILSLRDRLDDPDDLHLVERIGFQPDDTLSEEKVRESIRALQKKQDDRLNRSIQEELSKTESGGAVSDRVRDLMAKKMELARKRLELDLA